MRCLSQLIEIDNIVQIDHRKPPVFVTSRLRYEVVSKPKRTRAESFNQNRERDNTGNRWCETDVAMEQSFGMLNEVLENSIRWTGT